MEVLLLRVTGEPHALVPVSRALALAETGRAVLLAEAPMPIRTASGTLLPRPMVMSLTRHVPVPAHIPRWTKRGVLDRDGGRCAYCGGPANTVDHVHPRHRCLREGCNPDTWENTVAACVPCQKRKGGLTLREAKMRFRSGYAVYVPRFHRPHLLRAIAAHPEWCAFARVEKKTS